MIIGNFYYEKKSCWCLSISTCDAGLDLETEIKLHLQRNSAPARVYVLRPDNKKKYEIAKERIPNFENSALHELTYLASGLIQFAADKNPISKDLRNSIKQALYSKVFKAHDAVIAANHQSYFSVPSGKHSTHFIRTANIFTNSEEINILSVFLLELTSKRPDIIYCDTPAIFSIVYASVLQQNETEYQPKIQCFSPYKLQRDAFGNIENALFVISASINGSLPSRLNTLGIDWSKISVLFNFSSSRSENYNTICFLDTLNDIGQNFRSLSPTDFKSQFPDRTFEIKLGDDHFIPTPPTTNFIKINKEDAPIDLSKFIQKYKDFDFISCYYGTNSRGKTRDLYFDVQKVLRSFDQENPNYFEEKTQKLLINVLPINLKAIVHIDEQESKYIAELIYKYYKAHYNLEIPLYNYKSEELRKREEKSGSYLICSSCISDGKKIASTSMLLRKKLNAQLFYFNGFLRCKDATAIKEIKSSIQYGKYGFATYQFISIDSILLPNEDSETASWELEKEFITGLLGINDYPIQDVFDGAAKAYFNTRLTDLNNGKGLKKNVFLSKENGQPLRLNNNFAFFDFSDWKPHQIAQSTVYFTILSVLHNIRIQKKITQTVYERHLLLPENFNRFNDGVIQASILRSAIPGELNFKIDAYASRQMTTIVSGSISDVESEDSAPYEFLMALCIRRMTLRKSDLNELHKKHARSSDSIINTLLEIAKYITDSQEEI